MRKRTLSFMSIRSVRLTTDWMWNIWFCICIACVSLFSRPNYFPFRLVMMKSAVQIEGMKMGFSKLFEIRIEMLTAIFWRRCRCLFIACAQVHSERKNWNNSQCVCMMSFNDRSTLSSLPYILWDTRPWFAYSVMSIESAKRAGS